MYRTFSVSHLVACVIDDAGIICPVLEAPANGMVMLDNEDRIVGTVANYTCLGDLELTGSSTRICESDGEWNGTDPLCQGRESLTVVLWEFFVGENFVG